MKKIAIRVDASKNIGLGHLQRCLALASELKKNGYEITLIVRDYDSELLKTYLNNKHRVIFINSDLAVHSEPKKISDILSYYSIYVIVFDIKYKKLFSNNDNFYNYLKYFKKYKVIIFDDLNFKVFPSTIAIIPYVGTENRFTDEINTQTKYLLGPNYFILRNEFINANSIKFKNKIENILITMGGSNIGFFTEKVVESILKLDKKVKLTVLLVEGANYHMKKLDQFKNESNEIEIEYILNCENMAKIMQKSDLAVINSGLTKYETMSMGLPTIVISNNENHGTLMNEFEEKTEGVIHLGVGKHLTSVQIAKSIEELFKDPKKRKKLHLRGLQLIDSNGCKRIVSNINNIMQ